MVHPDQVDNFKRAFRCCKTKMKVVFSVLIFHYSCAKAKNQNSLRIMSYYCAIKLQVQKKVVSQIIVENCGSNVPKYVNQNIVAIDVPLNATVAKILITTGTTKSYSSNFVTIYVSNVGCKSSIQITSSLTLNIERYVETYEV